MCFSATGSFAAAGLLAAIGATSLAHGVGRPARMVAAVPLLFSVQQAAEGVVWLTIDQRPPGLVARVAVMVFLGFALVVWPAWLPASLRLMEQDPQRRRLLGVLSGAGAVMSAVAAVLLVVVRPAAHVSGHHIAYDFAVGLPRESVVPLLCYLVPTAGPFFVSTRGLARLIGAILVAALVVTLVVARTALTSVWCFFAALLSALILAMVVRAPGRLSWLSRAP
ncbi:MAG TPA: DUF6629 family protein [Polyangia bacterium]|nr:DUF6629 family protein [Polyangia bacterium]